MSGPSASGTRGLARLAALFSLRTISGKLIIGLALLFGVASVAVSVVTDHSLSQSLMSSLNQQLQAASRTWYGCVQQQHRRPRSRHPPPAPGGYGMCSNGGQGPGTFELLLAGKSVLYKEHGETGVPAVRPGCRHARRPAVRPRPALVRSGWPGSPDPPPATTHIRTLSSLGGKFLLTKVPGPERGTTLVTGCPWPRSRPR